MTKVSRERPLGAYRVVELGGVAPMMAGKTLADLGADVVRVEPPCGDPGRALPPRGRGNHDGTLWTATNLGKRSVTADLSHTEGCELVRELIERSDVLIEDFPPGMLESRGMGPDALRRDRPKLIVASITTFGRTGPRASCTGSALVSLATGGYLYMTGPSDGPPLKPSAPYQSEFHAGMHAAAAILLALRRRRRSGHGAHIDLAIRETATWMLTHTYQFYDLAGVNLRRQGSGRDMGGGARLRSVFEAADGYIVWMFMTGHIGGRNIKELIAWMGDEHASPWLREIDWDEFDLRSAGPEILRELDAQFARFFKTKSREELTAWALDCGVMLSPVQTLAEVLDDPQLAARDAWRTMAQAGGPRVPGPPVRMSGARWEPRGEAPSPGAHNSEVYGMMGVDASRLDDLRERDVI
ncbi:MAG TPA: CaiB/BaiF CoA-transferase family protein [Dehalococcoidia bacterium]|nr:CaiB/BaiF CoA-transferase family protein [Dehalococcoidia bacterium]